MVTREQFRKNLGSVPSLKSYQEPDLKREWCGLITVVDGEPRKVQVVSLRDAVSAVRSFPTIDSVQFRAGLDSRECLLELTQQLWLGQISVLDLGGLFLGDEGLSILADAAHSRVQTLILTSNKIRAPGIRDYCRICSNRDLPLSGLVLMDNQIGDQGAMEIANSNCFRSLEHLVLTDNGIGDAGAESLLASQKLPSLRRLDLYQNPAISRDLMVEILARNEARMH